MFNSLTQDEVFNCMSGLFWVYLAKIVSVKTQLQSLKAIFHSMDDVILSCYNYGSLAAEHNMY